MKILLINKFYYPKGGSETYIYQLTKLLEGKGHEVIPFSMQDHRNWPSEFNRYFVSNVELNGDNQSIFQKIKIAGRIIYSSEAKKKLKELIKRTRPDIAHINAICYQLTPSILYPLKQAGIPIVQTSHEYQLICPNQRLFNLYSGKICEECKGQRYYKAITNKCIKDSLGASILGCAEAYLYKWLNSYRGTIDIIVTPSNFMRNKLIEFGMNLNKVIHVPNFINLNNYQPNYNYEDYILYFGGLRQNKGLQTLIKAMKICKCIKLNIVGEGEIEDQLKQIVKGKKINNVYFLGYKSGKELKDIVANSMFTILPAEWYENCPLSVLESFALGKPVVGSNIGGIPELITDGVDGLLFESKNTKELAEKIQYLINHKDLLPEMGRKARQKIEEKYNSDLHYQKMIGVYEDVLRRRQGNR